MYTTCSRGLAVFVGLLGVVLTQTTAYQYNTEFTAHNATASAVLGLLQSLHPGVYYLQNITVH